MKKIMIALLVVASIFVLASCAPAVVTQTLTLKSVDGQVASGSVSVTKDDNAKAYYMADGGYLAMPASEAGDYGTLTYAKTQLDGSSQDTYAFAYKGDAGATGSEDQGKVYIGVLNSDAKSFKTKYAEVTINASAEWSGSTPVAVALDTNTNKTSKTLAAAGIKIYVDGVENIEAVNVKDAAGNLIGVFEVDFSSADKKTIEFEFTDGLDKYAASVDGTPLRVEVKNGTVVVGTYVVTCSHIGSTPAFVAVELKTETQEADLVEVKKEITTDKGTLYVWVKNTDGVYKNLGVISTDPIFDETDCYSSLIYDEDIQSGWSVGKMTVKGVGKVGKALTGVNFVLDTKYDSVSKNGALGEGSEEYEIVLRDGDKKEYGSYKVSVTIDAKVVGLNSVVGSVDFTEVGIDLPAAAITDVWCYDAEKKEWDIVGHDLASATPLYDSSSNYVGKIYYVSIDSKLYFSTEDYDRAKASFGKGTVYIGLNFTELDNNDPFFEGKLALAFQNVEVSDKVSIVKKVTDYKGTKGASFEVEAEVTDVLYCRNMTGYSKGAYTWNDWFEFGADVDGGYNFNFISSLSVKSTGTFNASPLSVGGFKCWYTAAGDNYGQTGYYELAVVGENGEVKATYWVEGTDGRDEPVK